MTVVTRKPKKNIAYDGDARAESWPMLPIHGERSASATGSFPEIQEALTVNFSLDRHTSAIQYGINQAPIAGNPLMLPLKALKSWSQQIPQSVSVHSQPMGLAWLVVTDR